MKKFIAYILAFVIITLTVGCAPKQGDAKYKVVTSFYPVMLLTKMVTEDIEDIAVSNLAAPDTGCLHDYTLLPNDLKNLEDADVFVINGLGMEAFTSKIVERLPNLKTVDLSKGVEVTENNPHIWLSPKNAQKMIANLCYELVMKFPKYSDKLNENTKKYTNMLIELEAEIKDRAADFNETGVITFHEAFSYFAADCHLTIDGTIQREPGEEPTPKELTETTNLIKEKGTKILLTEPQYPHDAADALSRETGAAVYEIDPIVTGSNYDLPEKYFEKMRSNINILKEAIRKD